MNNNVIELNEANFDREVLSAANPVLRPEGLDEGIDASDPDLIEWKGNTLVYFSVGDQLTWMNLKRATYPGSMADFLASWFTIPGIPDCGAAGWEKTTR